MGAWGIQPTENDAGLDWAAENVAQPLAAVIERTLKAYLDGTDDEVEETEAEAAAALLVDSTSNAVQSRYRMIDLRYDAKLQGLWDLALQAVDKMIADDWMDLWDDPQEKLTMLKELRTELEAAKEQNKDMQV